MHIFRALAWRWFSAGVTAVMHKAIDVLLWYAKVDCTHILQGHPIASGHLYDTAIEDVRVPLQWRQNEHGGVSNHWRIDCLLKRLFRRRSKNTSKLRVTSLCEGNSPVTGEFPAQMASDAENISIQWRHYAPSIDDKQRKAQHNRVHISLEIHICIYTSQDRGQYQLLPKRKNSRRSSDARNMVNRCEWKDIIS